MKDKGTVHDISSAPPFIEWHVQIQWFEGSQILIPFYKWAITWNFVDSPLKVTF